MTRATTGALGESSDRAEYGQFGQLYLDDGIYNEKQIIPADWVEHPQQYSEKSSAAG